MPSAPWSPVASDLAGRLTNWPAAPSTWQTRCLWNATAASGRKSSSTRTRRRHTPPAPLRSFSINATTQKPCLTNPHPHPPPAPTRRPGAPAADPCPAAAAGILRANPTPAYVACPKSFAPAIPRRSAFNGSMPPATAERNISASRPPTATSSSDKPPHTLPRITPPRRRPPDPPPTSAAVMLPPFIRHSALPQ